PAQVCEEAERLAGRGAARRLRVTLLTPTRLVEADHLVKPDSFTFRPLLGRLLERLTALSQQYAATPPPFDAQSLLARAATVQVAERQLTWRELFRASGRQQRMLPMGGMLGSVVFDGGLSSLLP